MALPDGSDLAHAPVPAWSHAPRLVVTDDGDDTLAILSIDVPPALLGFAPVGDLPLQIEGAHRLAAAPDGQTLYVNLSFFAPSAGGQGLGNMPGKLLKLRADNYEKIAEVTLDHDSDDVVLTRDGGTAYVSHYDLLRLQDQLQHGRPAEMGFSSVAVVDTASMQVSAFHPVCPTAHGEALSPDEKTLYVTCSLSDQLGILDLATHAATRVKIGPAAGSVGQPSYFPYAVTISPSDGSVWVSCNGGSGAQGWAGLRVYDPAKHAMDESRKVPLSGLPMFGDWLPDGKTLLVPHQGDDKVSFVDTATATEVGVIALPDAACLRAAAVRVAPDGQTGWLVCEGDHIKRRGTLVTLDLLARSVAGYVEVGLFPDDVVALPAAL